MAAQHTTLCDRLIELCDAEPGATNMNTMRALHDALATMHERMEISEAKATGGTTGEMWAADHFGLEWEKQKRTGHDAHDEKGRPCEIKAGLHPLKTKMKTSMPNIDYTTPARLADESDDAFVARTMEHVRAETGGHYWVTWTAKSTGRPGVAADAGHVALAWWLPSVPLAQLIARKMRLSKHMASKNSTIKINFGGLVCRNAACGGIHRIDKIVRALGGWNQRTDALEALDIKRNEVHEEVGEDVLDALLAGKCKSQC